MGWPFFLMLVALGVMWLPLILLLTSPPEEKPEDSVTEANRLEELLGDPRFFAKPHARNLEQRGSVRDRTVTWLEDYLRSEREQAERFVSKPSVGSLYRNCGGGMSRG